MNYFIFYLVICMGFEPMNVALRGRCVNRFTNRPLRSHLAPLLNCYFADFACSQIFAKSSGLEIAISESIFLLILTPALFNPFINFE